jgi:ribosome maturation protein SDO1
MWIQALELIRELQKQFPISRAHMKLRLVVPLIQSQSLLTTLDSWNARVEAKDEMNGVTSVMCQVEPGHFRECDALVRKLNGRLEVVSMAIQREGEGGVDTFNDDNDYNSAQASLAVEELQTQGLRDLTISSSSTSGSNPVNLDPTETERARASFTSKASKEVVSAGIGAGVKQQTCNTCNSEVGDAKQYREHFKSDWHKHNLKRKMKGLPPLSPDECLADTDIVESVNDLNEYSR